MWIGNTKFAKKSESRTTFFSKVQFPRDQPYVNDSLTRGEFEVSSPTSFIIE